jgi:hypothetical protein
MSNDNAKSINDKIAPKETNDTKPLSKSTSYSKLKQNQKLEKFK